MGKRLDDALQSYQVGGHQVHSQADTHSCILQHPWPWSRRRVEWEVPGSSPQQKTVLEQPRTRHNKQSKQQPDRLETKHLQLLTYHKGRVLQYTGSTYCWVCCNNLGPTYPYHYEHKQVESSPASSSTLCIQWLQSKEQHQCHGDTTTMANSTAETCRCQDIHDLQIPLWPCRHTSKHLPAPHCPFYQRPLIEVYVAILPDRCYVYRFSFSSLVFVCATSCRLLSSQPCLGTSSPLLDAITILSAFILHMWPHLTMTLCIHQVRQNSRVGPAL